MAAAKSWDWPDQIRDTSSSPSHWAVAVTEIITDRFLWTLDDRIEGSPNEAERGRWVKMRDAVGGAGRDLFVDVLGAAISKQVTGSG